MDPSTTKSKMLCKEFMGRSNEILQSGIISDCTFLVGQEPDQELISANKSILAVTSPVFEAMFYGSLAEQKYPISITDIHPDNFNILLNYIYTDEIVITSIEQAGELYYSAKKYMLPHLQQRCSDYLFAKLDYSNTCSVYEFGQLFDDEAVKDKAKEIMSRDTKQVPSDPNFIETKCNTLMLLCKEFMGRSNEILYSEAISDCTFLVGQKPDQELISANKSILAVTSPVFETMFYGSLAEKQHPISIQDIYPANFNILLDYIYTDDITITSIEQAGELYYSAKKFMLPHLQQRCSEYFIGKLDYSNACRVYEYGQLFEDEAVMDKATEIMSRNTKRVLNDPSFLDLKISTLIYLFSIDKLIIQTEIDLLEAAVKYNEAQAKVTAQNDPGEKTELSTLDAIEKIRFLTVSPKKFADCKVKSSFLSKSEILAILLNLVSPDTGVPYPKNLCNSRIPRAQYTTVGTCSCTLLHSNKCYESFAKKGNYKNDAIKNRASDIIRDTKRVLTSFPEIKLSTLLHVFSLDYLVIDTEMDLFEAVVKYFEVRAEEKTQNYLDKKTRAEFTIHKMIVKGEINLLEARLKYHEAQTKLTTQNDQDEKSTPPIDNLFVTSDKALFEAAVKAQACQKLFIQDVIKSIRFLTVSPKTFADCKLKSSLLSESDILAILLNIVSPDTDVAYPKYLCKSRVPRVRCTCLLHSKKCYLR